MAVKVEIKYTQNTCNCSKATNERTHTLGRLDAMYPSHRAGGMTVLNINNNANKSILRFVIQGGRLHVNGRIFGVKKLLVHETNWKVISKALLKMLWHGAKNGL